jgi:hypothetical protein
MPKYDEEWHRQDMADELTEYEEASGFIDTWSELSDVAYTYTRAKRNGDSHGFLERNGDSHGFPLGYSLDNGVSNKTKNHRFDTK